MTRHIHPFRGAGKAAAIALGLLALAAAAWALKTSEVEFGVEGFYDGQTRISRDAAGRMLLRDTEVTTPATLFALTQGARLHGALNGLGADDHAHYLTTARHEEAHDVDFNAALAIPEDPAGHTTLGGHVADASLHLRRSAPEEITGGWRFTGALEAAGGRWRLEPGAQEGDVWMSFADDPFLARLGWSKSGQVFWLNRKLEGAASAWTEMRCGEIACDGRLDGRSALGTPSGRLDGFYTIEGIFPADLLSRARAEEILSAWTFSTDMEVSGTLRAARGEFGALDCGGLSLARDSVILPEGGALGLAGEGAPRLEFSAQGQGRATVRGAALDLADGGLRLGGAERLGPSGAAALTTVTIASGGWIALPHNGWMGLGPKAARLAFEDATLDVARLSDAKLIVSRNSASAPPQALAEQLNASGYAQVGAYNSAGDHLSFYAWGRSATGTSLGVNRAGAVVLAAYPYANAFVLGTYTNLPMIFSTNNSKRWILDASGHLKPNGSGYDLGDASNEVREVFAITVTESSDARGKTDVAPLGAGLGLGAVRRLRPVTYRQAGRPLALPGTQPSDQATSPAAPSAAPERSLGLVAQEVEAALASLGLDARELGVVRRDAATGLYGLRYTRLIPLLIQALREMDERVGRLEAENESLRARLEALERRL